MKDRIIPLTVVVILGILVGVTLSTQKFSGSLTNEQLSAILRTLRNIEAKTGPSEDQGNSFSEIQAIKQRTEALETQQNTLQFALRTLQDAQMFAGGRGVHPGLPPSQPQAQAVGGAQQGPPAVNPAQIYDIEIAHSFVQGKKDASVTIVEFVDFQCPFCAKFHPPIVQVLKEYPNQVSYVVKNFPLSFHPQARSAAKAALAAGEQGKYFEVADLILENNQDLSEAKFEEFAKKLGLNGKKFLNDYKEKDAQWEKIIEEDIALGNSINVGGTPTFFINGRNTNARDFSAWKGEIDKILQEKE